MEQPSCGSDNATATVTATATATVTRRRVLHGGKMLPVEIRRFAFIQTLAKFDVL